MNENVDTVIRDSLGKTNSGDEDKDPLWCCTLPGSNIFKEDSREDMYKWPLTDSTTVKDHNVVAHVHEAPRSGGNHGGHGHRARHLPPHSKVLHHPREG